MSESVEYLRSSADTIVALSSPPGPAPRGVLRLSGPRALAIVGSFLVRGDGPADLADLSWGARPAALLIDRGTALQVDVWVMRAPRSYTGQDVVELHLPGSPALLDLCLERFRLAGARPALPGEFTERAFLNGRLDLAQAEAVAAVIHAESEDERRAALTILEGRASRELDELAGRAKAILAAIELDLDFSDQDIEIVVPETLAGDLAALGAALELELRRREALPRSVLGDRLLLVGAANAGKSSLFNALQDGQRALVSELAGTTRDYLEADLELAGGRRVTLVDCAGTGHEGDDLDAEGHRLRERELARAAARIEVVDGRLGPGGGPGAAAVLRVATRADLVPPAERGRDELLWVSSTTGEGLAELKRALAEKLEGRASAAFAHLAERQGRLLARALESVHRAEGALAEGLGLELVAADLHDLLQALRAITGADYDDEVLSAIMRDFCIGK
ncbi:MAG: 50S ribosome-binding GTPase [Planctomycetes bacterium]|nr:50S ribosome-binding GTPase [Planctomycetota bacterium]